MNKKTLTHFRNLLRFSGLFNIILAFPFIIPGLYEYYLEFYNALNDLLMLGGNHITIPTDPFHALFIHTAGIDLVLIGSFVLWASRNPMDKSSRFIILFNGIGRSLFFIIVMYYGIIQGLIGIFVVIGIIDIFITSAFIYYLLKTKSSSLPAE